MKQWWENVHRQQKKPGKDNNSKMAQEKFVDHSKMML